MFPSKREISRSNRRMGDNLSKWESPVQNRRVETYATTTPQHHWSNCSNWGYWSNFPTRQLSHEHIFSLPKICCCRIKLTGNNNVIVLVMLIMNFFLKMELHLFNMCVTMLFQMGSLMPKLLIESTIPFPWLLTS